MRRQQSGFTLIELITVVVILGVLAAFAIPRFASLETEARAGALKGLAGSVRSGAALAHAKWMAVGTSPPTVDMEGNSVEMDAFGYPKATSNGIDKTLQDLTGFTSTGAGVWNLDGAPAPTGTACKVTYTLGTGGAAPSVATQEDGC